jgi:hypothetical protein
VPGLPLVGMALTSAIRKLSERKARLVGSAACRQLACWSPGPAAAEALDAIEEYADTGRTKAALRHWRGIVRSEINRLETACAETEAALQAQARAVLGCPPDDELVELDDSEDEQDRTAGIIRVLGAIERAATERRYHSTAECVAYAFAARSFGGTLHFHMARHGGESMREVLHKLYLDIAGPKDRTMVDARWLTSNVIDLATAMYQTRDSSAMPILGDALMDAGCDNEEIIAHCRGEGPHVRRCWVVDLVLGKE